MQRKPKIIMLGWRDKPARNSGIGYACESLARALASEASIQMIHPKIDNRRAFDELSYEKINVLEDQVEVINVHQQETGLGATPGHATFVESLPDAKEGTQNPAEFMEMVFPGYIDPYRTQFHSPKRTSPKVSSDSPAKQPVKAKQLKSSEPEPPEFEPAPPRQTWEIRNVMHFAKVAVEVGASHYFDLIYAHEWATYIPGMALQQTYNKPLVLHVHTTAFDRGTTEHQVDWTQRLEQMAFERADLILAVSSYTSKILQEKYGISSQKIRVVHNGGIQVPPNARPPLSSALAIGFAGRMTHQKGPEYFLDMAFELVEGKKNVRFVMFGEGPLRESLIQTVNSKGMGHLFHFPGILPRDKYHLALLHLNLLVMPSVSEPFGLVALEAAQLGVPCLVSKLSGVREVLPSAPYSIPWKSGQLAKKVNSLIENPKKLATLGKKLQKEASKATWEKAAKKAMKAFDEVLPPD